MLKKKRNFYDFLVGVSGRTGTERILHQSEGKHRAAKPIKREFNFEFVWRQLYIFVFPKNVKKFTVKTINYSWR